MDYNKFINKNKIQIFFIFAYATIIYNIFIYNNVHSPPLICVLKERKKNSKKNKLLLLTN
jgi:hypothetical protein